MAAEVREDHASGLFGPPDPAPLVTGAPYSADEVQDYVEPGSTAAPESVVIGHFSRDARGRERMVRTYKVPMTLTEIFNPAEGIAYLFDVQKKIAHRMRLPPTPAAAAPVAADVPTRVEKLGTRTIEGTVTEGTSEFFKITGNRGRDLSMTIEAWKSPELQINMFVKSSNGYSTRIINLIRQAPDPALFSPPLDYTVVDEQMPFPMTVYLDRRR